MFDQGYDDGLDELDEYEQDDFEDMTSARKTDNEGEHENLYKEEVQLPLLNAPTPEQPPIDSF